MSDLKFSGPLFEYLDVPPGMLSSSQIKIYMKAGWLVDIENPEEKEKLTEHIKSATYDMRLGNFAVRFEGGNRKNFILDDDIKNTLTFEPNSLTFITTYEKFKLPKDVIARFNLKSSLVHKGLLLGTGPIVDPEFTGRLAVPIHNFSNQRVYIDYKAPIIAVEFTKTLPIDNDTYVINKNQDGDPKLYINKAGEIESSVYAKLRETKNFINNVKKISYIGIIALIISIIALGAEFLSIYNSLNTRIDNLYNIDGENKKDM